MNNTTDKTDWDAYYDLPYKTASLTRRYTTSKLINFIKQNEPSGGNPSMAELGGANSCFFNSIQKELNPTIYHIVDNNRTGLDKFKLRCKTSNVSLHEMDVLNLNLELSVDVVFSVGLIEHFSKEQMEKCVKAHFQLLKPGGIAVISFPTPTFLYNITRFLSESLGLWIFHDEKPLKKNEVVEILPEKIKVIDSKLLWPIFLTQWMLVLRKEL